MKNIWYKIVRFYVFLGLRSYFRKVTVVDKGSFADDKAYLFVANHRNGLLDSILIATTKKNIFHFLTRASAFKNPIASFLLHSINMLPIYRIRDGKDSIQKNQGIFDACYNAFDQNESVLIFAEGNHGLPRRVRPLSKGFTRIAFGYLAKNPTKKLYIIPVGLNYTNIFNVGSRVNLYYGKAISANKYYNPDNEKQAIDSLKNTVFDSLTKLTTHIDNLELHDSIEKNLLNKGVNFLNPEIANDLIQRTSEWKELEIIKQRQTSFLASLIRVLFYGNTLLPILLWKKIQPTIKDVVLISTFRFGIGLGLIPIYYLIFAGIISYFFSFKWGGIYLISSILLLILYRNTAYKDSLTT